MKNIKTIAWALLFLFVVACDKESSSATAAEPATTVETLSTKADTSAAPSSATGFKEGTDYTLLSTTMPTRDPNKIEVIEFFWYGCPHCYALEPRLEAWVAKLPKNVDFWRSPIIWGPIKEIHAQAYYTAEALGVLDKTHPAFFNAMHAAQEEVGGNAYAKKETIKAFFKTMGVTETAFEQNFASFLVLSKVKLADARGRNYSITGVPTLIVNGKYVVQGAMPNSLKVVDYLIQKEKKK